MASWVWVTIGLGTGLLPNGTKQAMMRTNVDEPQYWNLLGFIKAHFNSKLQLAFLSGVPDYFDRNKISSGGDLSHYSSASLY